ncbi:MAG: hypothetical protein ACR2Q3_12395 [Woeseiaceae bacterium]
MPNGLVEKLGLLLDQASRLGSDRNIVAHNPLYLSFYKGADDINFELSISPLARPEKQITLERLQKLAEEAEQLANDIYVVFNTLSDNLGQQNRQK